MKTNITLKSLGLTGPEYIARLKKKGYNIGTWAEDISKQVPKSKKGTNYDIVILKCSEFDQEYPTTQEIRTEAQKRGYITPPAEVVFLLREKLSDKEIEDRGLYWLIVGHEPITVSVGPPSLLGAYRDGRGPWVHAYYGHPTDGWGREDGFVFLAPQVSELSTSKSQTSSDPLLSDLESRIKSLEDWKDKFTNALTE